MGPGNGDLQVDARRPRGERDGEGTGVKEGRTEAGIERGEQGRDGEGTEVKEGRTEAGTEGRKEAREGGLKQGWKEGRREGRIRWTGRRNIFFFSFFSCQEAGRRNRWRLSIYTRKKGRRTLGCGLTGTNRGLAEPQETKKIVKSQTLFKTFACEPLDDGNIYLRADYSIEWLSQAQGVSGVRRCNDCAVYGGIH